MEFPLHWNFLNVGKDPTSIFCSPNLGWYCLVGVELNVPAMGNKVGWCLGLT